MRKFKGLLSIPVVLIMIRFLPDWLKNIVFWLILLLGICILVDLIRIRSGNIQEINMSKLNNIIRDIFKSYPNINIKVEPLPKGERANVISLFVEDNNNYIVWVDNNRYLSEVLIKGIRDLKILFSLEDDVVKKINNNNNIGINFDMFFYIKKSMFSKKFD